MLQQGLMFGLVRRTLSSRPDGSVLKAFIFGDAYDMSTTKQVPLEERAYPLSLAGNPAGGEVFPLTSIPGAYRITIRHNPYCAARKRSVTKRTTYGVVIRDKFYFIDEYHQRFTKRGHLRSSVTPSGPGHPEVDPGKKAPTIELPGRSSPHKPDASHASGASAAGTATTSPEHPEHPEQAAQTVTGTETPATPQTETGPSAGPDFDRRYVKPETPNFFERLLEAVPLLYQAAQNSGLVDDLNVALGDRTLVNQILSIACHWLISENNIARHYPMFAKTHVLPFLGDLDEEQLAKIYSGLGSMKQQISRLFSLRAARLSAKSCVNFDSTTITTSASDACYAQVSLSKEGQIEPLEHFSLLVDQETRLPVLYRLYEGNTPDCKTIGDLSCRLNEIAKGMKNLLVCDRGYETLDNLLTLTLNQQHCLMAVRTLKQSDIAQAIAQHGDELVSSSKHLIRGTNVNGMTLPLTIRHGGHDLNVWLHLFFSHNKAYSLRENAIKKINRLSKQWDSRTEKERYALLSNPILKRYFVFPGAAGMSKPLKLDTQALDDAVYEEGFLPVFPIHR